MFYLAATSVFIAILFLSISYYLFAKKSFLFWHRRKVPYLKPTSFIFGNYYDIILGHKTPGEYFRSAYNELAPHKLGGLFVFLKPILVIRDPDIIKDVLRNMDHFDRNSYMVNPKRTLTKHLFNLSGVEWKAMRSALLPAFSPGKMKMAFELANKCSNEFLKVVSEESEENNHVDIVDVSERYCIDIMMSFIFGLESKTLIDPSSVFRQIANKQNKPNIFTAVIKEVCPKLINILNISSISKDVEDFFYSLVYNSIALKEKTEHPCRHHDFVSVMMKLMRNSKGKDVNMENKNYDDHNFYEVFKDFDLKLMSAQCFIMFMAGFKPTSFLMNCLWLEIAKNWLVQEKIQQEIDVVLKKHDNQISCESLYEMTYLEQVILETIRLHPVSPILFRSCNKDYSIPNTDLMIEKGTEIVIPIYGIHHDSKYYSTPDEFSPEHFSKESQSNRPAYSFISFGEGPRQCIAMRLASMMVKLALIKILHRYSIALSPKMSSTLRFTKYLKVMRFDSPILVHCIPRVVENQTVDFSMTKNVYQCERTVY